MADQTLVIVNPSQHPGRFGAGVAVTVILLTAAWLPFMGGFIEAKTPFSFSTGESNVADLIRRSRALQPDLAIVGSSLCNRLEPGYFETLAVSNLCVDGGSLLTGLEVLRMAETVPRVILIEINILTRGLDKAWTAKGLKARQPLLVTLFSGDGKPIRFLLTKPRFKYYSQAKRKAMLRDEKAKALKRRPATYDNTARVQAAIEGWNRQSVEKGALTVRRMEEVRHELEARGAQVFVLYLPYEGVLNEHPFAVRSRILAGGTDAFDCSTCVDVRKLVDVGDLRWRDGAHLDQRSAAMVADGLEHRLLTTAR